VYEVYDEETFLAAEDGIAAGTLQGASGTRDRPSSRSGRSRRWPAALALALAGLSVAAVVDDRTHPPRRTSANASAKAAPAFPLDARVAAKPAPESQNAQPSRRARTTRRGRLADPPRRPATHAARRRARRHAQVRRDVAGAKSPAREPGSTQAPWTGAARQHGRARVDLEFGFEG
jgi:hypothetical protein